MKIRQGFVSNSSSTSFGLFIPNGFDAHKIDLSDYPEKVRLEILEEIDGLVSHGGLWGGNSKHFSIVKEILIDDLRLDVVRMDGAPGDDQIVTVNKKRIAELM